MEETAPNEGEVWQDIADDYQRLIIPGAHSAIRSVRLVKSQTKNRMDCLRCERRSDTLAAPILLRVLPHRVHLRGHARRPVRQQRDQSGLQCTSLVLYRGET